MKTKITTVREYDSRRNHTGESELQENIKVFEVFIKNHRKALKNYANERYPFKGIINFITISITFPIGIGKCQAFEAVIYPSVSTPIPNKDGYLIESFSSDDIGGRKVKFTVFGPEKKEKDP